MFTLTAFVRESNRIEGIQRAPTRTELRAHTTLLACDTLTVDALRAFVAAVQPGAILRDRVGLDVQVGRGAHAYVAPPGGADVARQLETLLAPLSAPLTPFGAFGSYDAAYAAHLAYESLHPFTDGNGRSGRAVWLWCVGGIARAPLGFLHHWYYASLRDAQTRARSAETR